jgi:hypothetical protein
VQVLEPLERVQKLVLPRDVHRRAWRVRVRQFLELGKYRRLLHEPICGSKEKPKVLPLVLQQQAPVLQALVQGPVQGLVLPWSQAPLPFRRSDKSAHLLEPLLLRVRPASRFVPP